MKSDSESVLKIGQITIIFFILIVLGVCTQLLISNNTNEIASIENQLTNNQESIENNQNSKENDLNSQTQLAEAFSRENNTTITSRSSINRYALASNQVTDINATTTEDSDSTENKTQNTTEDVTYKSIEDITISKDMDLTERCGISKGDFKTLIGNTSADTTKFFYDNSDIIYDLCEEYQINEIFFCGLMAGESGWNIASNHRTKHNYISMMSSSGTMISYSTVEEGLEAGAKLLHTRYLTPGASCYSGKTLSGVQKRFCPNSSTWVNLIYTCMKKIVR